MTLRNDLWLDSAVKLPVAFAQVREDALLDLRVVQQLGARSRVIMVASGGCTAALLAAAADLSALHLVDPNPAQMTLARLKLHLLCQKPAAERLALLGHAPMRPEERMKHLDFACEALDVAADALGPADILADEGPDHAGRYERVFVNLREALGEHEEELAGLLALRDPVKQSELAAPESSLGRALDMAFDEVLSLPNLVRLFGSDATNNRVESFSRHFARRTRWTLGALPAADNPYLWQMLRGRFPTDTVTPWLTAPSPSRMPHMTWTVSRMAEALGAAAGEYDLVHLSNILDWLTPEAAQATLDLAWSALKPGGLVFIRQLNSTLNIRPAGPQFQWLAVESDSLHAADRSFFYRALHLGKKS